VFTARYALSPYIKQIRFFKRLKRHELRSSDIIGSNVNTLNKPLTASLPWAWLWADTLWRGHYVSDLPLASIIIDWCNARVISCYKEKRRVMKFSSSCELPRILVKLRALFDGCVIVMCPGWVCGYCEYMWSLRHVVEAPRQSNNFVWALKYIVAVQSITLYWYISIIYF
jgi:hypothetical protein